jgi:hypothetical protein
MTKVGPGCWHLASLNLERNVRELDVATLYLLFKSRQSYWSRSSDEFHYVFKKAWRHTTRLLKLSIGDNLPTDGAKCM